MLKFQENEKSKAGSKIVDDKDSSSFEIKTTTIDKFREENDIDKIDFIKLDVDGAELEALKGAENALLQNRPQLAVCLYHKIENL